MKNKLRLYIEQKQMFLGDLVPQTIRDLRLLRRELVDWQRGEAGSPLAKTARHARLVEVIDKIPPVEDLTIPEGMARLVVTFSQTRTKDMRAFGRARRFDNVRRRLIGISERMDVYNIPLKFKDTAAEIKSYALRYAVTIEDVDVPVFGHGIQEVEYVVRHPKKKKKGYSPRTSPYKRKKDPK